ncbi:uncharacterized protein LOC5499670 isoform X2 [Nematostella vectensis]|uniref:uncharacterized protein LOC5499670 isoform X2 n=1 Tax=Nematostella vectensis TaxID=45351 RepID=UPI00207702BF|nr:uncharacterized protein LOC5499670 isoform X2 [Nematostella vectensis]
MAARREKGFYRTLNSISSVDLFCDRPLKRIQGKGRLWEVDRLVLERKTTEGKGFSPYDATWEPVENMTSECVRLFYSPPMPDGGVLHSNVAVFRAEVEVLLKSRSRLPVTFYFRGDVFRYLFNFNDSNWHYLERDQFPATYFLKGWDQLADMHGQGIKVFYPMKVRSFVSFTTKKYSRQPLPVLLPRAFQEKVTVSFVKVALGDK